MNNTALQTQEKACANIALLPSTNTNERLLRIHDLRHITGLARSTVYAKMQLGDFPQPVRLHGKCIAWKASEIDAWIAALPRAGA